MPPSSAGLAPALLAALLAAACGGRTEPATEAREPRILTTFYPLAWMTRRIAGGHLRVGCPLPPGEDPATWRPSRDVLRRYQQAALIVTNGAGFEKWVVTASLPASRLVATAEGFRKDWITLAKVTHSHGGGGKHTHEGIDGHTWTDPVQAKAQALAIRDALVAHFPEHAADFQASARALVRDLDRLAARIRALGPRLAGVQLLCNHPAYNYLARRNGWKLADLFVEPGAALSAADLARVPEAAGAERRILLWERAPLPATAARLEAELGIRSVVFSPCENPAPAELAGGADYLSLMAANLDRLEAALTPR